MDERKEESQVYKLSAGLSSNGCMKVIYDFCFYCEQNRWEPIADENVNTAISLRSAYYMSHSNICLTRI